MAETIYTQLSLFGEEIAIDIPKPLACALARPSGTEILAALQLSSELVKILQNGALPGNDVAASTARGLFGIQFTNSIRAPLRDLSLGNLLAGSFPERVRPEARSVRAAKRRWAAHLLKRWPSVEIHLREIAQGETF
ncbi:hypothetical protein [Luteolibacter sp. LG18]|uniref:hypothetical protein n=1 Tax=Luteolibacter sp. LG18 TaxID=2819286 RepID=UPI002B2E7E3E|nr:hypothetical protein llg_20590 [Luteolibacter sp. LG18]